jgi:phosphocarrier protein HPr
MVQERTVTIHNEEGLHARPAGMLVKTASEFKATVELRANGAVKNAKSIMGVMSLGLERGNQVTIVANGEDAEAAVIAIESLVNNRFAQA